MEWMSGTCKTTEIRMQQIFLESTVKTHKFRREINTVVQIQDIQFSGKGSSSIQHLFRNKFHSSNH